MRSRSGWAPIAVAIAACLVARDDAAGDEKNLFDIGRPIGEGELRSWNIEVAPDGAGLPPGQGSVREGQAIYERRCIGCHGPDGGGQPMDRLAGGEGTLASDDPIRTIGSYWPYATTVFDYVRRAMPIDQPQSLTANEVYALTAYLLSLNGIVGPDTVMNAQSLPSVRMPNRSAFRPDPRPDASNTACQSDCSP
jgi:S-disulfanyl-L-cysteine oxidoreductase SoxD